MSDTLSFEPHARLLTMLGDQLIKNERIALVELIKNSYDADATWVKVAFLNFGPNYEIRPSSAITIEDNGTGMTREVLTSHWRSPATPHKRINKLIRNTTERGRIIQGEKGIGRFAILKLGRTVSIETRSGSGPELKLGLDISAYDDDFLTEGGKPKSLPLSAITMTLDQSSQPLTITEREMELGLRKINREPRGTKISITNLRGSWSTEKVKLVFDDMMKLQSIFDEVKVDDYTNSENQVRRESFEVIFYKDSDFQPLADNYLEKLRKLIEDKPVIRITDGSYDEEKKLFKFKLDGNATTLRLDDPQILGLKIFRDSFGKHGEVLKSRNTTCGPFSFNFYIFDLNADPTSRFGVDKNDREILNNHRIYLYRDNIRVYPYGEPDDDWLQIDALRGKIAASYFLSNDQVIGHVGITQSRNPLLTDKTSREGLIDIGTSTDDFIHLLQVFLAWVRKGPYAIHVARQKMAKTAKIVKLGQVEESLQEVRMLIGDNLEASSALDSASKLYKTERSYLIQRAETTENLAGVGLSVETAAHDIMSILQRGLIALDALIKESERIGELSKERVHEELMSLRGMFSFVESQLKDVQLLFNSSRQRRRDVRVMDILRKVNSLFNSTLAKENIEIEIHSKGSPLIAKTTDAVLLQLFLNLFDNSVYWLATRDTGRKIEVLLDGDTGSLTFADNGPGVHPDDIPYIFEPFYSGRGEDGRGLGLYIARQLLDRHDYTIELEESDQSKLLSGANFVVSFLSGAA